VEKVKNSTKFGLSARDQKTIAEIFEQFPEVTLVHIFGSRAKGNFHPGSDIDLAIMNEGVDDHILRQLKNDFEESSLPYFVDVINFPTLKHEELKEHIEQVGKVIYFKK
jgi:uncharacterized protein